MSQEGGEDMTIPERPNRQQPGQLPRAPMAPSAGGDLGLERTQPLPGRPQRPEPSAVPAGQIKEDEETVPSLQRVRPSTQTEAQPPSPIQGTEPTRGGRVRWYDRQPVIFVRDRAIPIIVVGGIVLCAVGALAEYLLLTKKAEIYKEKATPTTGIATGRPPNWEFACSPATNVGAFVDGAFVDTIGKGGAVLDVTKPGQHTVVTVIPPNTDVSISGAIHEWLYNSDCSIDQITQQARDHAATANDPFVSDYHSVTATDSPVATASQLAMHDRIAQRKAVRTRQEMPVWRRVFTV